MLNNVISSQALFDALQAPVNATGAEGGQSTSWNGFGLTANKLARCWLVMAPVEKKAKADFYKIAASETGALYLTDYTDKYYFKSVPELPEYLINDTILNGYFGYTAGSCVGDIINSYKAKSNQIFFGQVDLPHLYEFAVREVEDSYFYFDPAYSYLMSEFSESYIMCFSHFDLGWETNSWNAYTCEGEFYISLILPNYEVDSKIKFSGVLDELMCLPPGHNKSFCGGSSYREAEERFNSKKVKRETGLE